jgi:hypothetical protein
VDPNTAQTFLDEDGKWRIGGANKGKVSVRNTDGIFKMIPKVELPSYIENGWSKSSTTENTVCLTSPTGTLKYVSKESVDSFLNEGYALGNTKSGVNKNIIHINKNGVNKRVFEKDVEMYLKDGWELGQYRDPNLIGKFKRMHNPLTKEIKHIPNEEVNRFLSEGWLLGVWYRSPNNKGKRRMKDLNGNHIYVFEKDVELKLNAGYMLGWKD